MLDLWSKVSDASRRWSTATGMSETAGLEESLNANLTRMQRFEERASLARTESESWSEQAAQVRAEAQAIDRELGQPFFAWLSERVGADGRALGRRARSASPRPRPRRTRRRCASTPRRSSPSGSPRRPVRTRPPIGGEAEYGAARDALADAHARETAAAYGAWAEGVRDRAYVADAPIPGEVKAAASGERMPRRRRT